MNPPPQLTNEQRALARESALAARRQRAELRRELAGGTLTVADVLDRAATDPTCANLPVRELLISLPGVGEATCAGIMERVGISATRRVRGLGIRQAAALRALFEDKNNNDDASNDDASNDDTMTEPTR